MEKRSGFGPRDPHGEIRAGILCRIPVLKSQMVGWRPIWWQKGVTWGPLGFRAWPAHPAGGRRAGGRSRQLRPHWCPPTHPRLLSPCRGGQPWNSPGYPGDLGSRGSQGPSAPLRTPRVPVGPWGSLYQALRRRPGGPGPGYPGDLGPLGAPGPPGALLDPLRAAIAAAL